MLALVGVLPSLAGEEWPGMSNLDRDESMEERPVLPALTMAAQLQASGMQHMYYSTYSMHLLPSPKLMSGIPSYNISILSSSLVVPPMLLTNHIFLQQRF